jgi:hypothetical protein
MDSKIKLKDSNGLLVLSINKQNIEIYFDKINFILNAKNFNLIKTSDSKYWTQYFFNTTNVELSFNDLKKIIKKDFLNIEFKNNDLFQMDENSVNLVQSKENKTLIECYSLWCPFIK